VLSLVLGIEREGTIRDSRVTNKTPVYRLGELFRVLHYTNSIANYPLWRFIRRCENTKNPSLIHMHPSETSTTAQLYG